MVSPIAKWLTRTGHRFTDTSDILSLDVLAETNYQSTGSGGEGGIASVEFKINGTAQPLVTSRSTRTPNYTKTISPRTGTLAMRPVESFGMDLEASSWPNGTITVDAKVTTVAGSVVNLPQIKVYNNITKDTRPSSLVIYVSPSGDDANDGLSTSSPLATIQKGFEKAAVGGDLGGAEVILMPGVHSWSGYSFGMNREIYTSDDWWVTLRVQSGATIERAGALTTQGDVTWSGGGSDTLYFLPNTGAGQPDRINLLMVMEDPNNQAVTRGDLKVYTNAGTSTRLYVEGGVFGNPTHNSSTNRWSVRFAEYKVRLFDHIAGGSAGNGELGATNVTCLGNDNAFVGFSFIHECVSKDWTGLTMQSVSAAPSYTMANVLVSGQRYNYEVSGLIDCEVTSGCTMEIVDSNTLRIQQSSGSVVHPLGNYGIPDTSVNLTDLSTYGDELLASDLWGITVYNGTTPQSGGLGLPVVASGTNGTGPYIEITWTAHGYSSSFSLAGWRLKTSNKLRDDGAGNPYPYTDQVHPDVWQFFNATSDTMVYGVRVEDSNGTRVWASSSSGWDRIAFVNCADASLSNVSDMQPPSMADCLFFHCTFGASADFGSLTGTGINEVRRCVFNKLNNAPTGYTFDGCFFVNSGDALGTASRTGTWFASDPETSPWNTTPATSQQGLAGGTAIHYSSTFTFPSAGGLATEGAWLDATDDTGSAPAGPSTKTRQRSRLSLGLGRMG